jgi:hypothetical protein
MPVLHDVGTNFQVNGCSAIQSILLPVLDNISGDLDFHDCTTLVSFSPQLLREVDGSVVAGNCPALDSAKFPSMNVLGGDWFMDSCTVLTRVDVPVLVFQDGHIVNVSGGALLVATVNSFLHRLVISGVTADIIDLSGGTNAPPAGQGAVDKASLIVAGNTVNTN